MSVALVLAIAVNAILVGLYVWWAVERRRVRKIRAEIEALVDARWRK